MDSDLMDILREALETRQRKEDLERAVGRAVRRRGLDFRTYQRLMDEIRLHASENNLSAEAAAMALLRSERDES